MPNSSDTANTVTVIIPNWNGMAWLERCLAALHKQTLTGAVVILVDNGSTDGSLALVRKGYPTVA
jgi:GT2 family glycosyltransferase